MDKDYNAFHWWKIACIDNFLNFSGRARRKEYWYFVLVSALFAFAAIFTFSFLEPYLSEDINQGLNYFFVILFIAYFLVHFSVAVRRLQDSGKAGFYFFVFLIPLIGYILLLSYLVADGTSGFNRYGYSPKLNNPNAEIDEIGSLEI